jgi:hypothetical protein
MKKFFASLLAGLLAMVPLLAVAADDGAAPMSKADAVSALMGLAGAASAFRAECAKVVDAGEVQRIFDGWQARNQATVGKVDGVGRSSGADWVARRDRDAATVRQQVASLVAGSPEPTCRQSLREFESGTYDLSRFPSELHELGIQ